MMRGGSVRLAGLLLAAALALGAAACGSDGDGGDGAGGSAQAAADGGAGGDGAADGSGREDATSAGGGSAEDQVAAAYAAYIEAIYEVDYAAACATLTSGWQRALAKDAVTGKTCERALMEQHVNRVPPGPKPRVVRAKVGGATAVGHVKSPSDQGTTPISFAKEGGAWKVSGWGGRSRR